MKKFLALCLAAALLIPGCVKVDNSLGEGLVDKSLLLNTYTVDFPLSGIALKHSSDLSAYSDTHLTIGSLRDETFGLTTRDAAFTLIPALDEIDLGDNPVAVSFNLFFTSDTISVEHDSQERILQNIFVYELLDSLPSSSRPTGTEIPHSAHRITAGTPTYNGTGALDINFTQEFAQKYVDVIKELGPVLISRDSSNPINKYKEFVGELPGIYMETDDPVEIGGRINLFDISCLSVVSGYYQRNENIGLLTVNSTWDGERKDSTFVFVPGETEFVDEVTFIDNNTKFSQYSFNMCTHETVAQKAGSTIMVEGGGGLKPVISALELQQKTRQAILDQGGDPEKASIISASIILPFDMPEDYRKLQLYPSVLSPTISTTVTYDGKKYASFAGLTDASVSAEDQGNIDRSNLMYSPDITYHMQEILHPGKNASDLTQEEIENGQADIWLLTLHSEQVETANGQTAEQSAYYQNLMYASYYNSLYGGGYGGYGSGYGNNYSNYYSYMMLAQMMAAQNQTTYTTTTELDKDRFYKALLNGPLTMSDKGGPHFQVVFTIPKE